MIAALPPDASPLDTTVSEGAFASLLQKLSNERGVPCSGYKPSCLRRRLQVRMRATGVKSFADYAAVLDRTPHEWARLLDALTVNVTAFFRDTLAFEGLRDDVIATLPRSRDGLVTAWSAGCSSGEEAWTLAMLLADAHGTAGMRVHGTDVDPAMLSRAAAAVYPIAAIMAVPGALRTRWCRESDVAHIDEGLRARVTLARHDLLLQDPPASDVSLIACRNVIIYFSREAQQALFTRLADALAIDGVLVLGKTETLSGPAAARFVSLNARERIYRRVA